MPLAIRKAIASDIPVLDSLIRASVLGLQNRDYTAAQMERALEVVFGVDSQLVADGTYFAAEGSFSPSSRIEDAQTDARIIGCGGWSKRRTLYGGDRWAVREDALLDPSLEAAKIRAFFVHPDWARRGVGSRLLEVCENEALAAGFRRLKMGSTLTGVPLYQARGYRTLGQVEVDLGCGMTLPIVHMEKRIR